MIKSINELEIQHLWSDSSNILFLIQYIIGLFFKKYSLSKNDIFGIMTFSSILTLIFALLLILNISSINVYSKVIEKYGNAGGFYILFILNQIIKYNIFFINSLTFIKVFINHTENIKSFFEILQKKINDAESFELNTVVENYSKLKNDYEKSVEKFNTIFSTVAIFSVIQLYYVLIHNGKDKFDITEYVNSVLFLIIFGLNIYVIKIITSVVDNVKSLLYFH